jgi:hypothetical protein
MTESIDGVGFALLIGEVSLIDRLIGVTHKNVAIYDNKYQIQFREKIESSPPFVKEVGGAASKPPSKGHAPWKSHADKQGLSAEIFQRAFL